MVRQEPWQRLRLSYELSDEVSVDVGVDVYALNELSNAVLVGNVLNELSNETLVLVYVLDGVLTSDDGGCESF